MPSTDDLLAEFDVLLSLGFSVSNARNSVERKVAGTRQGQWLREALDRLVKKEADDGEA